MGSWQLANKKKVMGIVRNDGVLWICCLCCFEAVVCYGKGDCEGHGSDSEEYVYEWRSRQCKPDNDGGNSEAGVAKYGLIA